MQTKKYLILLLAVAILALVLVMCNSRLEHTDASQPVSTVQGVDTVPMLITQVQKCAKLYTAEYHVHKIVTHDDVVRLKGTLLKRGSSRRISTSVLSQRKTSSARERRSPLSCPTLR